MTIWTAVDDELREARQALSDLEDLLHEDPGHAKRSFHETVLALKVRKLQQLVLAISDHHSLPNFLADFKAAWSRYKDPTAIEYIAWIGVFYCPPLEYLADSLAVLGILINKDNPDTSSDKLVLLEQMLRGSAKMLHDRGLVPSKESEIRNAVYGNLIHVFPDALRDIPIAKVTKTYKPDIGVPSLKAAVEYKFLSTEIEARTCISQIYEDIHGYGGSADWTTFFAVLYFTNPFFTSEQIDAEWKMTDVPHRWKLIVVHGPGARMPIAAKSATGGRRSAKNAHAPVGRAP